MQSKDTNASRGSVFGTLRNFAWRNYIVYIAFIAVFIYFSISLFDDGFLTSGNLLNIFRHTATISLMGLAMNLVISSKEIDLSVGAITALSSLVGALALQSGFGILGALVAGVGVGILIGLINGFLVTRVAIPSFLA